MSTRSPVFDAREHIYASVSRHMADTIALSVENVLQAKGGPFAALIVKDDEVIAAGKNLVTATNDPTAHAEIVAIRRACHQLRDFRLTGCDVYASCEPCPMCMAALYWARPSRIYFAGTRDDAKAAGFDDAYIYEQIVLPLSEREIPIEQLMRDQALLAFREWARQTDKIPY